MDGIQHYSVKLAIITSCNVFIFGIVPEYLFFEELELTITRL